MVKTPLYLLFLLLLLTLSCSSSASPITLSTQPETGLKSWEFIHQGLDLKLVQRLPDQTRGFFLGRGFTESQANDIATNCVFQTAAKNINTKANGKAVSIDLSQWQVKYQGREQGVKLKEQWKKQWQKLDNTDQKVNRSAQIAFRWSTFPSQQTFDAGGDYNWGMISFGLPPGQTFDLLVKWLNGNKTQSMLIKNIICPAEPL